FPTAPGGLKNKFVQAFWGSRALATASETKATRRDFLYIATGAVGAVGVAGAAWPLIHQLNPDASELALASMRFDVSTIEEGCSVTILCRGLQVFVRHRTSDEIEEARAVPLSAHKNPQLVAVRILGGYEEWLIMVANCPHAGCVPVG